MINSTLCGATLPAQSLSAFRYIRRSAACGRVAESACVLGKRARGGPPARAWFWQVSGHVWRSCYEPGSQAGSRSRALRLGTVVPPGQNASWPGGTVSPSQPAAGPARLAAPHIARRTLRRRPGDTCPPVRSGQAAGARSRHSDRRRIHAARIAAPAHGTTWRCAGGGQIRSFCT
jgi:hypothetical protein